MSNEMKALLGIGAATILILIGGVFFMSKSPSTAEVTPDQKVDKALLIKKDSFSVGDPKAKVALVEFGDFQCPACASAHPVIKRILEDYDGKVYFQFRHFPLPQHRNAKLSAYVAEAAGGQKKYWEMFDMLYENQTEWSESTKPMEFFEGYAKKLELDVEKLKEDVKKESISKKVDRDVVDGGAAGVNSTPTFFINGVQLRGIPQYADLQKLIDAELGK